MNKPTASATTPHLHQPIKIVEVGPRDGLQNLPQSIPASVRATLVDKLAASGLKHIEVGSFVSPKWVPQMADSDQVFRQLKRQPTVVYSALIPNLPGFERALAAGATEVAVFVSASEPFSQQNMNNSIAATLKQLEPVMAAAQAHHIPVRGYVSCVMGCPYAGPVTPEQVVPVCTALLQLGCYEIALGDTLGVGTPWQAKRLFQAVAQVVPCQQLAAHFHNTYGQALANLYALIEEGLTVIDTAIAGLGGCPYAPGASGNVATEDVVYMLSGRGMATGINMTALLAAARYICKQLGIPSHAHVGKAMAATNDLSTNT